MAIFIQPVECRISVKSEGTVILQNLVRCNLSHQPIMNSQIYFARNAEQLGPFSEADWQSLAKLFAPAPPIPVQQSTPIGTAHSSPRKQPFGGFAIVGLGTGEWRAVLEFAMSAAMPLGVTKLSTIVHHHRRKGGGKLAERIALQVLIVRNGFGCLDTKLGNAVSRREAIDRLVENSFGILYQPHAIRRRS